MTYVRLKRGTDLVGALLLLIPALPILLCCALFIKLEDAEGPVFFRQTRAGQYGKLFILYKLRSMRMETHQNGRKLSDGERLLRTGKIIRATSLDELPQLWNILKGEMSFIGPRPLMPEYLPHYTEFEQRRHEVLPGISGWAQVNGRTALHWEARFELDVEYVESISLAKDLHILVLTVRKVFLSSDIVEAGEETTQDLSVLRSQVVKATENKESGMNDSSALQIEKRKANDEKQPQKDLTVTAAYDRK